jgi:glycosyltransferase involved in cell wall biosynthesis
LPYVLVESLSNGLPAIVTDVGGVSEAISDKETGYVVSRGDESAFLKRLSELCDDKYLRETMSIAGKKRFEEFFQQDIMFQRIESEYNSLLDSG